MTTDPDDELRRRLAGMSADLDGVSLPGPSAARERGARRTRHQVTGGVLAGVAAVAAGVLVFNPAGLGTTPEPAPPASLSTLTTEAPTTAAAGLGDALLTSDDVAAATQTDGWERQDERLAGLSCDPGDELTRISAITERAEVSFAAPDGLAVRQDLARFGADPSLDGLWTELRSCLPDRGAEDLPVVTDEYQLDGVGDEGMLLRYYTDPSVPGSEAVTIALVRYQDAVSVTARVEPQENTAGGEIDTALPVAAAERMCSAVFGTSCVSDPALADLTGSGVGAGPGPSTGPTGDPTEEPTGDASSDPPADDPTTPEYGPHELADDPFLTDADVAAVGTATGFVRRPEMDIDFAAAPCLQDPMDYGAITVSALGYNHDLDASLYEWVGLMPDADSAFRTVAAHTSLPDVCGEVGADREQTVGEPVAVDVAGADDAVAWTVESVPTADNPGSETSFAGVGIASVGNIVVAVGFGAMDDPSGGDWPGVAEGLLASALERAVG
ncbi:hypothetical protein [Jiangella muralis]|uniref:hypothetical protein n=1 Tax=Jiangella muralis TaxID=702383 RepID=UPI00069E2E88|nr:hypothetical protein [Jiangella muralis]